MKKTQIQVRTAYDAPVLRTYGSVQVIAEGFKPAKKKAPVEPVSAANHPQN